MPAYLRRLWNRIADAFWLVPGAMTLLGMLLGVGLVSLDRSDVLPAALLGNAWVYNGGGTGARTLLGAIASSTIGVAGTVFSITIAALSLAAGQMGPRLLRNFTHDRGVQFTLGTFLGTFSYALMVLRSVRTQDEGAFTPHFSLTIGIVLAFVCVATLIYFVGHMAGRINVDTVVDLVSDDLRSAVRRLTVDRPQPDPPPEAFWLGARRLVDERRGYLQELDGEGLASWAREHAATIRLLVRTGDYVFPGAPIADVLGPVDGVAGAVVRATALGPARVSSSDLEFAVRQLVEVAVRALSPGINDPHTAISVLDRLGASLCDVACVHLATGSFERDSRVVLQIPTIGYGGLVDSMFHMIRQNAGTSVAVLARMLEVLKAVSSCERDPARRIELRRHADLILGDGERSIANQADLQDLRHRHESMHRVCAIDDRR